MKYDVMHSRPMVEDGIIKGLSVIGSATAHEVMGRRGAIASVIKPIRPGMKICGRALTVWAEPGDNLIVHKALSMMQKGDVLVVCNRMPEMGFWGEVMTVAAMSRGAAGLLTDGAVRDTEAIAKRGFSVFSANKCIRGTLKYMPGRINHPIVIGEQTVNPGDIILGDDDGAVVIPWTEAEAVLKGSIAREEKEAKLMKMLSEGKTTMEVLGLEKVYAALNLTEES